MDTTNARSDKTAHDKCRNKVRQAYYRLLKKGMGRKKIAKEIGVREKDLPKKDLD